MAELKTTDDLAPEQIAKQLLSSDSYHLIKIAQAYLELLKQRDGLLEDLNAALGVKHKPSCNTTHFGCDCVLATLHRYKTALDWYANRHNYFIDTRFEPSTDIQADDGQRARQALAGEGDDG